MCDPYCRAWRSCWQNTTGLSQMLLLPPLPKFFPQNCLPCASWLRLSLKGLSLKGPSGLSLSELRLWTSDPPWRCCLCPVTRNLSMLSSKVRALITKDEAPQPCNVSIVLTQCEHPVYLCSFILLLSKMIVSCLSLLDCNHLRLSSVLVFPSPSVSISMRGGRKAKHSHNALGSPQSLWCRLVYVECVDVGT